MEILSIMGENIASLAKPFDIPFDEGLLAGVGLFAITGDTGAGKSSLLDAMCLALYGNCPRLGSSGVNDQVPDVSGETLTSSDPRTILRRGAASGYACVRFRAIDDEVYEARWSVRRARDKANGRLQAFERSVTRLSDGKILENQKNAVANKVEELTRLTYEEFRRSVLLAQGDFDSFLRAKTSDRAAILEKVTNTGLYREISKRVYQAYGRANGQVLDLETRLGEHEVLEEKEKRALETETKTLSQASREAQASKAALAKDLDRYQALTNSQSQIEKAQTAVTKTLEDWDKAQEDVAKLKRLQKAAGLRAEWQQEQEITQTLAEARLALASIQKELKEAQACEATTRETESKHAKMHEELEKQFKAFGPQWSQAEKMDAQISTARDEVKRAEEIHVKASANLTNQIKALEQVSQEVQAAEDSILELQAILEAEPAGDIFYQKWDILEDRLAERMKASHGLTEAEAARKKAKTALERQAKEKAGLEAQITLHEGQIKEAEATIKEHAERRKALSKTDPTARLARLTVSLSSVQNLKSLARNHEETQASLAALSQQQAQLQEKIVTSKQAIEQGKDSAHKAQITIEALQAPTELAEAAISEEAIRLRTHLIDGEPCPVCGSADHPVHASDAAQKTAQDLRIRLDTARKTHTEAHGQISSAGAVIETAKADLSSLQDKSAAQKQDLLEIENAFSRTVASEADGPISERLPLEPAGAVQVLQDLTDQMEEWNLQLIKDRKELENLDETFQSATQTIEALRGKIGNLTGQLNHLAQQTGPQDLELKACIERVRTQQGRIAFLDEDLSENYSSITDDWEAFGANSQAAFDTLVTRKEAYLKRLSQRDITLEKKTASERKLEGLTDARTIAKATEQQEKERLEARKIRLETLLSERSGLLGGVETGAHRTAFNNRRMQALEEVNDAKEAHTAALSNLSVISTREKSKSEEIDKTIELLSKAHSALAAALSKAGLDIDEITDLLSWNSEQIDALSDQVRQLEEAKSSAHQLLKTRQSDHKDLLQKGLPDMTQDAIEEKIGELDTQEEQRQDSLGEIRLKLQLDKNAHDKMSELLGEIREAKSVRDTWTAVNDVVGSANGDRFAQIAQEVTLGILVEQANHHLADIKPRYRLALGTGKLSLHVVDEHMAGEIRSTRSLSGGEKFLVSLSLALALSSIGGRGTISSMLFIDEGFGTLDAESLEMAINTLEALQAQGRTIGVISHVQAMKDRIPAQIQVKAQGSGASEVSVQIG